VDKHPVKDESRKKVPKMLATLKKRHSSKHDLATRAEAVRKGLTVPLDQVLTIGEIEKALGIDKVKPIILTSSETENNFDRDKEYFKDMYDDELRELFKRI
jgi:hypothetical protein